MDDQPVGTQTQAPVKGGRKNGVAWGLIFILGGLILFAQQLGWLGPRYNWWALFILVPALASLGGALSAWQATGRFNAAARSGLGGGIVLLTLAMIFLLGLDWSIWWPLMVLAGGFSIFLEGFGKRSSPGATGILSMGLWIGLGVLFIGAGFLLKNLGILDLSSLVGTYKWWAIAILVPGFGALINGLAVSVSARKFSGAAFGLVIFGLATLLVGAIAFLGISWTILGPALLILLGLAVLFGIFRK